ncbi:MAG: ribonuclease Z [Candidatus Dormibacteraeota bacterium]|nr:ribonuclease Z [Candidatus Dormibacteraeota bacterium]
MELAFLGTGAAFSLERYNGAVCVDRRYLLDAGAPLLPHLGRLGIDPGGIEAIFLTHFHGDHLAGLIPYLCYRAFLPAPRALTIVGPDGVEDRVGRLLDAAWGSADWEEIRNAFALDFRDAGRRGEAAGVAYETVPLEHGKVPGMGYRLHLGGRVLVYAGDTRATPALDQLVEGADVAITEATNPGEVLSHTSFEQAAELIERHPTTRFFLNHVFSGDPPGAAHDLEVVEL